MTTEAIYKDSIFDFRPEYSLSFKIKRGEKTKVLSERGQQLSNGSKSFLKNPETYSTVTEIALEELRQNKIPFIIRRPISNHYEYWKLEDLKIV